VVHGFFGAGNLGDEAILAATVRQFRKAHGSVEFVVVSQASATTERDHPVRAIDRQDLHGQAELLANADALLFGGGGLCNDYWPGSPSDVLDDTWSGLPYYLRLPLLASLQGVPMVVFAQGVGPLESPVTRVMVKKTFDIAADISVRDAASAALLQQIGVARPVEVSADPALLLEPDNAVANAVLAELGLASRAGPLIAVSVRSFQNMSPGLLRELAQGVGSVARELGAHLLVLPFRHGTGSDLPICQDLVKYVPDDVPNKVLEREVSPEAMLGIVGASDLLVGLRLHACIFALAQGVPFVPIAYDPKLTVLATELELPLVKPVSVGALDGRVVRDRVRRLWEDRQVLKTGLVARAEQQRRRIEGTVERICRGIGSQEGPFRRSAHLPRSSMWRPGEIKKSVRRALEEKSAQFQELSADAKKLRDSLREKQDALNRVTAERLRATDETTQVRNVATKAEQRIKEVEKDAQRRESDLDTARKALEAARETERRVGEERDRALARVAELEGRVRGAEHEVQSRAAELGVAQEVARGLREAERRLSEERDRASMRIAELEGRAKSAEHELLSRTGELGAAQEMVRGLREVERRVSEERDLSAARVAALEDQIERTERELQARTRELSAAQELVKGLQQAECRATEDRYRLSARVGELEDQIERTERELQARTRELSAAQALVKGLQESERKLQAERERLVARTSEMDRRLGFAQVRNQELSGRLQEIWSEPTWLLMNRLYENRFLAGSWRLLTRLLPGRAKERFKRRLLSRGKTEVDALPAPPAARPASSAGSPASASEGASAASAGLWASEPQVIEELQRFMQRVDQSKVADLVVFVAGVKFVESEGQRVTQIIRELVARNVAVLLVYFRWRSEYTQPVPRSQQSLLFQLPMDLLEKHRQVFLDAPFRPDLRRTCVFEFPHPSCFQWVNEFNLAGWSTVYDIIDDWDEFAKAGKAVWYEPAVERYLARNATAVTAVVPSLAEKARSWVPGLKVGLVPNGVAPGSFDMTLQARSLPKGDVTVGYFGYLTPAWFDWELVASTARKHPRWVFHIVGYGEPVPVRLPDNVHLLGKVPHQELFAFAQNWDVALVPFKVGALSQGADPIKVYEYLTLGIPVVSTGIPHLRSYPGVYAAEKPGDFSRCIERAARKGIDKKRVKEFVDAATWYQRGLGLIKAGEPDKSQIRLGAWLSGKGGAD